LNIAALEKLSQRLDFTLMEVSGLWSDIQISKNFVFQKISSIQWYGKITIKL
jgi:hypothetical protein